MGAADKWLLPLVSVSFVSLMLFLSALSGFSASSALFARLPPPSYVRRGAAAPPSFAYLLSGARGDGRRLLRLLLAVYHPRNQYLLHLSADAPAAERAELAAAVARAVPAAAAFGNVHVVGRPAAGTPMGSSGLAATLRAAAALLRLDAEWDCYLQKHLVERAGPAGSSSTKKAKVVSKAESAASEITVTLDPKLLKCSVCRSTFVLPLYQCDSNHITCFGCCKDLEFECSLCGHPIDTRCRSVEHILCGMTIPCSFKEHGCMDMIRFTQKAAHEESCIHAPCYCPIAGCHPYAGISLRDHIYLEQMPHPAASARVVSLGSRGAMFLLVVDRSLPSGRGLSVIHLASEPDREDDFKYKIKVYTPTGILCLSGETQSDGRLTKAYQAGASLFVSDTMWSPQDSPVYIELKK